MSDRRRLAIHLLLVSVLGGVLLLAGAVSGFAADKMIEATNSTANALARAPLGLMASLRSCSRRLACSVLLCRPFAEEVSS
jgi:hypothetical protein